MSSPTQRSKKLLEGRGYLVAIVEHWNSFAKIRQDLFGFIDILAIQSGETLAVQTTSYSNMSKRIKKISESPCIGKIREANWKIEVHGWHKIKNKYVCKIVDIS